MNDFCPSRDRFFPENKVRDLRNYLRSITRRPIPQLYALRLNTLLVCGHAQIERTCFI